MPSEQGSRSTFLRHLVNFVANFNFHDLTSGKDSGSANILAGAELVDRVDDVCVTCLREPWLKLSESAAARGLPVYISAYIGLRPFDAVALQNQVLSEPTNLYAFQIRGEGPAFWSAKRVPPKFRTK